VEILMTTTRLRFAAASGLALALAVRPLPAQSREPFPGLDRYIANAVQAWKVPGLAVAIVRNDSVLYTRGFGVLAAGSTTPVNERTLFEIGSSSKAFTATLVAMMVSDGKMRWDDRLTTYLPDFRMYDPVANEAVTLRDALSHRSGIARGELVWLGAGIGRDEVLHRLRFLKPESPFRSKWSYQNMMFLAAGQAVGKVAGSSWDDVLRQRIFTPLGMTSSLPTQTGNTNPNSARPHGMDHDTAFVKAFFDGENIAPAGAIVSNAVDMAQWLRFQLNDGVANGKRLLSSAAFRETHAPQILMSPGGGGGRGGAGGDTTTPTTRFNSYGFGWMVEDYRNALVWQHGGNTPGMTTAVGMLPEKKFGVVVLSNMQSAALPDLLRQYIFDRELGAPMRDLSAEALTRTLAQRKRADSLEKVQQAGHPADLPSPIPAQAFVGTYADSLYGDAVVSIKDGKLFLVRGDWSGALQYWNATNFRWLIPPGSPTGPMTIKFDVSADNTVTGLWFGIGGDVTLLSKKGGRGGGRAGGRGGA
jgi:CubicO group peptidase (beta-lactamase class C family)